MPDCPDPNCSGVAVNRFHGPSHPDLPSTYGYVCMTRRGSLWVRSDCGFYRAQVGGVWIRGAWC